MGQSIYSFNPLSRWINCLITAIQKHKKFNKGPDTEEGGGTPDFSSYSLKMMHSVMSLINNALIIIYFYIGFGVSFIKLTHINC